MNNSKTPTSKPLPKQPSPEAFKMLAALQIAKRQRLNSQGKTEPSRPVAIS